MAQSSGLGGVLALGVVGVAGYFIYRHFHPKAAAQSSQPSSGTTAEKNPLQSLLDAIKGSQSKGSGGLGGGTGSSGAGGQTKQSSVSGPYVPVYTGISFGEELARPDTLQTRTEFNQMNPLPDLPTDAGGVIGSLADFFGGNPSGTGPTAGPDNATSGFGDFLAGVIASQGGDVVGALGPDTPVDDTSTFGI